MKIQKFSTDDENIVHITCDVNKSNQTDATDIFAEIPNMTAYPI